MIPSEFLTSLPHPLSPYLRSMPFPLAILLLFLGSLFVPALQAQVPSSYPAVDSVQLQANTAQRPAKDSLGKGISQAEALWAVEFESRMMKGHQPDSLEMAVYQDILRRYRAKSVVFASEDSTHRNTQAEKWWTLDLEKRVAAGYQPNANEILMYYNFIQRLQEPAANRQIDTAGKVSQAEIKWALDLRARAKEDEQPTAEDSAKFEDISRRLQAQVLKARSLAPLDRDAGLISPEERQWAAALESRVKDGYTPSPEETARYQRLQARLQPKPPERR